MSVERPHRRFLLTAMAGLGGLMLAGCDRLSNEPRFRSVLGKANGLTYRVQRFLLGANRLAPEYSEAEISPAFRANGSTDPQDEDYLDLADNDFADWRLKVEGLVERELTLSLADLRAPCRRAPRSPATTASRAGAASANGPACRSPSCCRARASSPRRAMSCSTAPTP